MEHSDYFINKQRLWIQVLSFEKIIHNCQKWLLIFLNSYELFRGIALGTL